MNISLSGAKDKKENTVSLGFGLNSRSNVVGAAAKNVFGDDSSDGEDDEDDAAASTAASGRQAVNQQIAKEQAALRKRAHAALTAVEDPNMYDYDGAYDTFKAQEEDTHGQKKAKAQEDRKSKYIGDLLKAAKVRERERDAIYERKIAREQAEEAAHEEFIGKEKFVTNAYKRKLKERKLWELQQEEKEREEEVNDVTKKSAGAAFASFYGNLNKNVSAGGDATAETDDKPKKSEKKSMESLDDFDPRGGFMADFEQSDINPVHEALDKDDTKEADATTAKESSEPKLSMRENRQKKIAEARVRYLRRREGTMETLQ